MSRPTYTEDQVQQIYTRINLPQKWRLSISQAKEITRGNQALELLSVLQRYHLSHIPFESLELHYSRTKTIDLDPQILFDKIVTQGTGRGGYCMENNAFFATILRTLGFQFYSTGGRVNAAASVNGEIGSEPKYMGFAHMINIVTIQGVRYMVDVGFGAGGITYPIPLEDGHIQLSIKPTASHRIRYDTIPENESDAKLWILERRVKDKQAFTPCYCFPDNVEFLPSDYGMMNYGVSHWEKVFFTYTVIAVRMVLSEDGSEIVGETVLVGDKMHRRVLGKKEAEKTLGSEMERVEALEGYLGIGLSEQQRGGIVGMVSALP